MSMPFDEDYRRVALLIKEAFQDVTLGNGVGLWEGRAHDDYADANGIASAKHRDERSDWSVIPLKDLCACESSLTFADEEGVRFLLPAFMLAELDDELPAGIVFKLTSHPEHDYHFNALSPAQRTAVREFLLLLKVDPKYEYERSGIERSLAKYWTE